MFDPNVQHMLTTIDNPYSPFTQWYEWYAFDLAHHYNTSELLARVTITSEELSNFDQALAVELAMDEIVAENINGLYRKVSKDDYKVQETQSS